jgi:hypothetical protein
MEDRRRIEGRDRHSEPPFPPALERDLVPEGASCPPREPAVAGPAPEEEQGIRHQGMNVEIDA